MRELFKIESRFGSIPINLSEEDATTVVNKKVGRIVIVDAYFKSVVLDADTIIWVPATEDQKDLSMIPKVIEACRKSGLTRDGRLIGVGGGIIQDICGFVASTYMRGIDWEYFPTTLLGMADSCIGGKSSINVGTFKNIVGTFHPPQSITLAPKFTKTLMTSQIISGLCEAAKICYAMSDESFDRYLEVYDALSINFDDAIQKIIIQSLSCKKWFVEVDEFDRNERLLLNLGHSFGHAIESVSGYAVEHGVAVGVGILAATSLSEAIHPELKAVGAATRLRNHMLSLLGQLPELPKHLASIERPAFERYFSSDKKHTAKAYNLILLQPSGRLARASLTRAGETEAMIWNGFEMARDDLSNVVSA